MNELEKKIAETLGSLMLENRKLAAMLEAANAENQKLRAARAEAMEGQKPAVNGHQAADLSDLPA